VTLFEFLSLKNDVNVASKSQKAEKIVLKNLFFAGILKVNDENRRIRIQDPDLNPDPLVRCMDPGIRIRIHPKMSWIRNTGRNLFFVLQNSGAGSGQEDPDSENCLDPNPDSVNMDTKTGFYI
jgi:hypothetical protein